MKIFCIHCKEEIMLEERHPLFHPEMRRAHRECFIRMTVGSLAHQKRECSCYGGNRRDEYEKLSVRQNAKAAMDYFLDIQNKIRSAKLN